MACTTLLVGKHASYDGSTMIARNDDSGSGHYTPKKLTVVLPSEQPRLYRSVLSHVEIALPENPMRYSAVPNAVEGEGLWSGAGVNEANVAMTATETIASNERVLGADPLVVLRKATENAPEVPGVIGIEDFGKVALRVAEVVAAEPVPKADKLLKLQLSLGEGQPQRQVVSGIAKFYQPDELVGKHVVLVVNLKPAKLRGVVSEGMILAASDGKGLKVLEVNMPAGTEVR